MQNKLLGDKRNLPDEHLEEYLKSTYAQRLNWLEEANEFVAKVSKANKQKRTTKKRKAK
jgi:hypothetical protein